MVSKGSLEWFFFALRKKVDTKWIFVDGSYIRVHQHAQGARCGESRAVGRSRGGPTTKIHMVANADGNPIDFEITGGEVHEAKVAKEIIKRMQGRGSFIADKGYDSDRIRSQVREKGMVPVIPRRSDSKKSNPGYDKRLYKKRHLVENLFARLKHFRSIATRFEKLARNFKAIIMFACTFIWLKLQKPNEDTP